MSTKTDETTCETCPNPIERTGKRGPAPKLCADCKAQRHRDRSNARHVPKERAKTRPGALKYRAGWKSKTGLVLVARVVGDSDRAWFTCSCGAVSKLLWIRNVKGEKPLTTNCAVRGFHQDPRVTDRPAYGTVHHRKAAKDGPAKGQPCVVCSEPAEHWAYLHGTPDVLSDETGREGGLPYSDDTGQYGAFCRTHHKLWDSAKGRTAGTAVSLAHVALWTATHDNNNPKVVTA